MSARVFNYDDDEPEIGVKELIKPKVSNSSTRREYMRMRAEKALLEKAHNLLSPVEEEVPGSPGYKRRGSLTFEDTHSLIQESEPEIASFPFAHKDSVDGAAGKKTTQHVEAEEHPGHQHGAKLCMISATMHMKCLVSRKPKSIKALRKNPITSQEEKARKAPVDPHYSDSDSESEPVDEYTKLKNCRYIRGSGGEKELSIEDIFR